MGLREGDRVLVFDEVYVVRGQSFSEQSREVSYWLIGDGGHAHLVVPIGEDGLGKEGLLKLQTRTLVVFEDEVVVLRGE